MVLVINIWNVMGCLDVSKYEPKEDQVLLQKVMPGTFIPSTGNENCDYKIKDPFKLMEKLI